MQFATTDKGCPTPFAAQTRRERGERGGGGRGNEGGRGGSGRGPRADRFCQFYGGSRNREGGVNRPDRHTDRQTDRQTD